MSAAFDIFNQYAADPSKELEGVWENLGPAINPDAPEGERKYPRILVARSGNKNHGRIVSKLYEANKATLDLKNDAADAKGEQITIESMAKAIYLGWENMAFKGAVIPDSATMTAEDRLAEAKRHLAIKDYRAAVMRVSENFEKFKAVQEQADAGN